MPVDGLSSDEFGEILLLLNRADCRNGDAGHPAELESLRIAVESRVSKKKGNEKRSSIKKLVSFINKNKATLEESLPADYVSNIFDFVASMHSYLEAKAYVSARPCREYRLATTPYLRYIHRIGAEVEEILDDPVYWAAWKKLNLRLLTVCR